MNIQATIQKGVLSLSSEKGSVDVEPTKLLCWRRLQAAAMLTLAESRKSASRVAFLRYQ